MRSVRLLAAALIVTALPSAALAKTWVVAPGGTGTGTMDAPFGSVERALAWASPGDTVLVRPGIYGEALRTVRDGAAGRPITIRGESGSLPVIISSPGTVLAVGHSYHVVENVVFDGDYGRDEIVDVDSGVHAFTLRRVEVRRSGRDCINIGAAVDVRIEDSLVHHCLNPAGGRTDAHGVVAGAVRGLTIRNTEIHTFSGDAIQLNRTGTRFASGWDDVRIEGCRLWLAPLPHAENGFAAGTVPGENALDTKVAPGSPRAHITIRDTSVWGFRGGLIRQQAAFNLKENIDAEVDGVTVWDSTIAFRLRGSDRDTTGAWVRIQNTVVSDVDVGVRYEDEIERLRVWNTTFGLGVVRAFEDASSPGHAPDVRNFLLLGEALPPEAASASNLAVGVAAFVDAASRDYRLAAGSPAVDAGVAIEEVAADRAGRDRPQGSSYDVGAYEWQPPDVQAAGPHEPSTEKVAEP